jgi:hypothetical protein
MRAFRFPSFALLSVLVAGSAVLYAQDEKQQENKPQQEEPRPEARQPEAKQPEMKAPKEGEAKPPQGEKRDEKQYEKQDQRQSHDQMRGEHQEQGHARPTGKSAHIPDEKFHAQFGREHKFVAQRPVIVEGQPRFQYGGYSFVLVDVWPSEWAYTDDVYIDYVDGDYFLYDLLHPGERIALFVVL